ncbi:hypothetical protein FOA43_003580 [Brettanomyces nanus]|uniref:EF-hand domain-containing protein n=1 Tax=Eeniella nana TaxID=13502 RepID=A0A875SBA7_EENNA|nr:uncharacterized protein FOA43_003580 [Brettanomyces nanus]QPG76194.1 hypothetical protein FOA43_003580 [Brettanomyces nanus]
MNLKEDPRIVITYPQSDYIVSPLKAAISKYLPSSSISDDLKTVPKGVKLLHYGEYEDLDHERLFQDKFYLANSYTYRKGLIRKQYLANTVAYYVAKHPDSSLKNAYPETFQLECAYAEFLDDALDEAYELRCDLIENEKDLEKTYILKPSMSDKGQGIRLFKTIDQLQTIFNSFDEADDEADNKEGDDESSENGIILSQMRNFVVQEYIANPLLLKEYDNRKFHIRTYVLCVGCLEVYVYQRMLMLFSESCYVIPGKAGGIINMTGHLTNTCLQEDTNKTVVVELDKSVLSPELKNGILSQINVTVAELFKASMSFDRINFQPLPNAFEIYGLDFLVDVEERVELLEVNAYPDFKQTGQDLKEVIYELFDGIVAKGVVPFFEGTEKDAENMLKVLDTNNSGY